MLAFGLAFTSFPRKNILPTALLNSHSNVVKVLKSSSKRATPIVFATPAAAANPPAPNTPGERKSRKNTKDDVVLLDGKVLEALPNAMFKVQLQPPANQVIVCQVSGKIRKNMVRIIVGDNVEVEVSAYDVTKGRITFRHK
eukprot:gene37662-45751_t